MEIADEEIKTSARKDAKIILKSTKEESSIEVEGGKIALLLLLFRARTKHKEFGELLDTSKKMEDLIET